MNKITFEEFCIIMQYNIPNDQTCVEIEFSVNSLENFQHSWMGKLVDKKYEKNVYWFGLTEDGTQAYDYESFEQFLNAKVFFGKNIQEIWNSVSILSIDACDIEERLSFYLKANCCR